MKTVMHKELGSCGAQMEALREESQKVVQQVQQRITELEEKRRKDEEKRQEEEKRFKEAQEVAAKLLSELEELIKTAETAAASLREEATAFATDPAGFKSMNEIGIAAKTVEATGSEARKKIEACSTFLASSSERIQAGSRKLGVGRNKETADTPAKPSLTELRQRTVASTHLVEKALHELRSKQQSIEKKLEAESVMQKREATFRKYDKDKDGVLNRKEAMLYVKGEFNFALDETAIDKIFKVIVENGVNGVKGEDIQRLLTAVGIARERERDKVRREQRLERESKTAELRAELVRYLQEVAGPVKAVAETLVEVAVKLKPRIEASSTMMLEQAAAADDMLSKVRESLAECREQLQGLNGREVEQSLRSFHRKETRQLERSITGLEGRLKDSLTSLKKLRGEAKKIATKELMQVQTAAIHALRCYQRTKGLSNDALFAAIDTKKDGSIDEAEFLAFFSKEIQSKESAEPAEKDVDGARNIEQGKDSKVALVNSDLPKLFTYLDEEGSKSLTQEAFVRFVKSYMKVVKDTVMSSDCNVKDGKAVKRLDVNEVVEVLEGPTKEGSIGVERVRAKAMSDGVEGWLTLEGNQGSVFLVECSGLFRVVKETILTDSFELGESKEVTRRLHDTTRKLIPGEIVEVREWPRLEPNSGLRRMRCRVRSDGHIGWATSVGNQGAVFLELI